MFMDEPQDPSNWGGETIALSDIKQAAAYLKSIWPSVPTGVGSNPAFLSGGGWTSGDLDFVSVPFTQVKLNCRPGRVGCYGSDVNQWVSGVMADAKSDNLGVVLSINVLNGGTPNGTSITAADLQTYGTLFASQPQACALTFWKWDDAYFSQSDIQAALSAIAATASTHTAKTCTP